MKKTLLAILFLFIILNSFNVLGNYEQAINLTTDGSGGSCDGLVFSANKNLILDYVYLKEPGTSFGTFSRIIIKNSTGVIYNQTYVNGTFNHSISGINLTYGTSYNIRLYSDNFHIFYNATTAFPMNRVNVNFTGSVSDYPGCAGATLTAYSRVFQGIGSRIINTYISNSTANGTYYNSIQNWIYVNVDADNGTNITIFLYNSTGLVNSSTSTTSNGFNFTSLPNNIYYYNATANNIILNTRRVNIYGINRLQLFFFDESNNSLLSTNVTASLSSINNNYFNSSTTGNISFINTENGTYTLLISAVNFTSKIYEQTFSLNFLNDNLTVINITLLSNITSVDITIILKDTLSRVIPDARVIISRAYSGNWVTISDSFSDDGGTILTSLQPGISHVVTIIANDFNIKNFVQIFESANSPYTFILSPTSGTVYTDIFNDVNISYSPLSSILQANSSYNFSLNALSTLGLLQWASINSSLNNTNMTGTVLVISTIININTSGLNTTYPVTYCVKQANFSQYCFIVNYYVEGRIMNNNSLENSFVKFKDNFTGNDTSWLSIMAIAAILCICIILTEISGGNVTVVTICGFVGLIFFAFVGWLNIVLVGFLVIIGGVLFFFNKGGQA